MLVLLSASLSLSLCGRLIAGLRPVVDRALLFHLVANELGQLILQTAAMAFRQDEACVRQPLLQARFCSVSLPSGKIQPQIWIMKTCCVK